MAQTFIGQATPTRRFIGRCEPCGRPVSAVVDGAAYQDRTSYITCPDCGKVLLAEQIFGTVTYMTCNPLCEGAGGPSCECACGGVNHGGAWSQRGEMLASELDRYRAAHARKAAEREARRERVQALARAEREEWAAEHAELAAYLAEADRASWPGFLFDMADAAMRGPLSERQAEVATRIMREQIARNAERAAEAANAKPAPAGTVTVTGEVLSTRLDDSPFSYGRSVSRMLVKADGGYRVWVTIPESINNINATTPGNLGGLRGKRVRFTCELSPKRDDPAFAYGKRPRKAEVLETVAA
jgi:hypothetical protein